MNPPRLRLIRHLAFLAWAEVLLTLDRADFGTMIGGAFYGLSVMTPGMFLESERAAGRLQGLPR